ncbi:MAG: MarR family transcriptional regulator [Lachnospiraceae bacterium]|nr:MarR family transcriptional regulator [Lachnospira sp.]MBR6698328.1 MarR family transcriptional regulator [Lachnospiraceae bacterium]
MYDNSRGIINAFLVDVFNTILKAEEYSISRKYPRLSVKEVHVIEAVCNLQDTDNRATAVAAKLRITPGTLTTAVSFLEKKGYLMRKRDAKDRRIVRIYPTDAAMAVYNYHEEFHKEMVDTLLEGLTDEEAKMFTKGLKHVTKFFKEKYRI